MDQMLEFLRDTEDGFKKGERVVAHSYRVHEGETVEWATERGHIIPHWQVKVINAR